MPRINQIIPPRKFEAIRQQIVQILDEELSNQFVLSSEEAFNLSVWEERLVPFDKTEIPSVNVLLGNASYTDHSNQFQNGEYTFFIDCYAKSKTTSTERAYKKANEDLQRVTGAIFYIMSSNEYRDLKYNRNIINKVYVDSFDIAEPRRLNDSSSQVMSRITIKISVNEDLLLIDPPDWDGSDTHATLENTDKGLYYTV